MSQYLSTLPYNYFSEPPKGSVPNSGRSPEKKRPAPAPQRQNSQPYKPPPGIPLRPTVTTQRSGGGGSGPQSPTKAPRTQPPLAVGPGKVMGTIADLTRGRKPERVPPTQPKYVQIKSSTLLKLMMLGHTSISSMFFLPYLLSCL